MVMRICARSAALVLLSVIGLASGLDAQAPGSHPAFDVAAVKREAGIVSGMTFAARPGGTLTVVNNELTNVIDNAYGIRRYQLVGGPDWINSDRYNIRAKASGDAGRGELMLMLRSLLEDRFKLRVHRETRALPIYVMTTAKGGLKVPPARDGSCVAFDPRNPPRLSPGQPRPPSCGNNHITQNTWNATSIEMTDAAAALVGVLGRNVVDKTGVSGKFDIHLEWTPDQAPARADSVGPEASAVSLFTVLEEQLGLKVESSRGLVDVLVIDHVERPTDD
jgi:uncharacterized protein (TIGR03435 family)